MAEGNENPRSLATIIKHLEVNKCTRNLRSIGGTLEIRHIYSEPIIVINTKMLWELLYSKEAIKKKKRQSTEWEKIVQMIQLTRA